MTTPKSSTVKTQLTQGSNIQTTPVVHTLEGTDDQKLDLMAEINIIQLALGKKGYRKRLEKVELKIRSYQIMEKELEILKKQQEQLDLTEACSQL